MWVAGKSSGGLLVRTGRNWFPSIQWEPGVKTVMEGTALSYSHSESRGHPRDSHPTSPAQGPGSSSHNLPCPFTISWNIPDAEVSRSPERIYLWRCGKASCGERVEQEHPGISHTLTCSKQPPSSRPRAFGNPTSAENTMTVHVGE